MTAQTCVWRDAQTGERVCLVPRCPEHTGKRQPTRCERTTPHWCLLGKHLPRREFGRAW